MTDQDEKDLPEFLTDPMSVLFDLNDEMLEGMSHMRYAIGFSFWAGGAIAIASAISFLWVIFVDQPESLGLYAFALAIIALVSAYACVCAHEGRPLLEDYSILGRGIRRANLWKPSPKMPGGPDPVSRLLTYLRETDDRIEVAVSRYKHKVARDASAKGKSKGVHKFDLFVETQSPFTISSKDVPEGLVVMVRAVEKASLEDVRRLKADSEDVLRRVYPYDQAVRVILLQTGDGKFPGEVTEFANKSWMKYDRTIDDRTWEWSSPIELIAEGKDGLYVLENAYFG
ncbi:MAG: hypothetical protein JW880_04280 [Candidatus Thermoplasmatota archaeon]|nr:hypothetical protein [Candidatus Thermoplasmatota archaeon]